jgi:hypothetical protein
LSRPHHLALELSTAISFPLKKLQTGIGKNFRAFRGGRQPCPRKVIAALKRDEILIRTKAKTGQAKGISDLTGDKIEASSMTC